jgi:hypothetical protein
MKSKNNRLKLPVKISMFGEVVKQHFSLSPLLIFSNIITIIVLSILSLYAKLEDKGAGVANLFSDPFDSGTPYLGWLTSISEILWCAVISICIFTVALISKNHASSRSRLQTRSRTFLLTSALIMSVFYIDDRFRITLILCQLFHAKIKILVAITYGSLMILYAKHWWWKLKTTPYLPLLICFSLFAFSSFVDVAPISRRGIQAMLEDGTKLIGLINLTAYFWYFCLTEIQHYYQNLFNSNTRV